MKILSLLFLTIFLTESCGTYTKQGMFSSTIEYTANSRGFFKKITIHNQEIEVLKVRDENNKPTPVKILNNDWEELTSYFKKIDLSNISNLKAPSEKRLSDGAAIANLKITYKGKTYQTTSFDHGNPPAEIEKIVIKINALVK